MVFQSFNLLKTSMFLKIPLSQAGNNCSQAGPSRMKSPKKIMILKKLAWDVLASQTKTTLWRTKQRRVAYCAPYPWTQMPFIWRTRSAWPEMVVGGTENHKILLKKQRLISRTEMVFISAWCLFNRVNFMDKIITENKANLKTFYSPKKRTHKKNFYNVTYNNL